MCFHEMKQIIVIFYLFKIHLLLLHLYYSAFIVTLRGGALLTMGLIGVAEISQHSVYKEFQNS